MLCTTVSDNERVLHDEMNVSDTRLGVGDVTTNDVPGRCA
jgi:hypothetical protein